jgi:hypothetical protein
MKLKIIFSNKKFTIERIMTKFEGKEIEGIVWIFQGVACKSR